MFKGSAEELRRMEREAADLAVEVARLLTRIEVLTGEGTVRGTVAGPGFEIRRTGTKWTVRT
ncbi:hypothetical protein [Streptomyces sp. NBC_01237]|uniref:hypothetical protein n=1 Tax=Streptomyces sp. NBC_01237 TaxID=2903790 RepID=UPI002DD8D426|nr:hypothetical protein [Streptomyces sp. NBC_01237]WRZ78725.1 hypothetical protein OG251_44680 [Streptomyces sp. NBC_01237]